MSEHRKDFIRNKKIKARGCEWEGWAYFWEKNNKVYTHSSIESIVDKSRSKTIKKCFYDTELIAKPSQRDIIFIP